MYVQVDKPKENKSRELVNSVTKTNSDQIKSFGRSRIISDVYQLKVLKPSGLGASEKNAKVWVKINELADGKEYEKEIPGSSDSRLAAMAKITRDIATTMDQVEIPKLKEAGDWTNTAQDMGKAQVTSTDPFRIKYVHEYKPSDTKIPISATVHIGRYKPGYIIEQMDGTDRGKLNTLPQEQGITGYNEDHGSGNGDNSIFDNGNQENEGKLTGSAWDERSKIIGEGWRFEPVIKLAEEGKLNQNSRFYKKVTDLEVRSNNKIEGESFLYSVFGKLAQTWGTVHEMPNKSLSKEKMAENQEKEAKNFSESQLTGDGNKNVKVKKLPYQMTDKDYDLGG